MFFKIKKHNIFIILLTLGIIFPIFLFAAVPVYQGEVAAPGGSGKIGSLPEGAGIKTIDRLLDILAKILQYIYTIFFIVAVLFILLTAYTYLTAQDDPEKISSAHKQLIWASVAIVVALMSLSINMIIQNFIKPSGGGSSDSNYIKKVGNDYYDSRTGAGLNMPKQTGEEYLFYKK